MANRAVRTNQTTLAAPVRIHVRLFYDHSLRDGPTVSSQSNMPDRILYATMRIINHPAEDKI
jgi:hypothetical protein